MLEDHLYFALVVEKWKIGRGRVLLRDAEILGQTNTYRGNMMTISGDIFQTPTSVVPFNYHKDVLKCLNFEQPVK